MPLSLRTAPNLAFIDYVCDMARLRKSIIYHDFIPNLPGTLPASLREIAKGGMAKAAYHNPIELSMMQILSWILR